jgi:hypothetical protein
VTPLYPQKLALTSPTSGGHFGCIVCLRAQATEFVFVLIVLLSLDMVHYQISFSGLELFLWAGVREERLLISWAC